MNRKIPLWLLVLVVFLGLNALVIFGWSVRRAMIIGVDESPIGALALRIASYPSLVKEALREVGLVDYKVNPQTKKGAGGEEILPQLLYSAFPEINGFQKNGVVQKGALEDEGYLLLSFFDPPKDQSIVQLIRIRDQQVLHEWVPKIAAHIKRRKYIEHPMILNDGGLVFHLDTGPMEKVNACSDRVWRAGGKEYHHSLEVDSDGFFWAASRITSSDYHSPQHGAVGNYLDDSIVRLSPDGKVIFEKSVSEILEEHGFGVLLFGVGRYDDDAVHLNDIQPALTTTKYWKKDDLLLSLRNISTVLLYRPSTQKIVWLKTGPWLNQHDADFFGDSGITVFGNDVMRRTEYENRHIDFNNNAYFVDLTNDAISTPFKDVMERADIKTPSQGLQRVLGKEDLQLFVEETDRGRILKLSTSKVKWEYTKAVSEKLISVFGWSRYLTEDEVKDILPILESANCE